MGKPMRPDTAMAFDQLAAAAHKAGIQLSITSAFRSDAEQARLFAAHPDPKWVAPPGKSLHRLGTELDLGPASAYAWLARNAPRFGFVKRYSWVFASWTKGDWSSRITSGIAGGFSSPMSHMRKSTSTPSSRSHSGARNWSASAESTGWMWIPCLVRSIQNESKASR